MRMKLFTALGAAALLLSSGAALAGNGLGITGSIHDRSAGNGSRLKDAATGTYYYSHYAACTGSLPTPGPGVTPITTKKQCEDAGGTWNTTVPADGWAQGEICRICHSPHDYQQEYYKAGLLWNRTLNESDYLMYSPNSENIGGSNPDGTVRKPGGPSKLCLSCHDGTIAIDVRYGVSAMTISAGRQISTKQTDTGMIDLRGTHPISIPYPDPATAGNINGRTGGTFNPLDTPVGSTIAYDPIYTANTSTVTAVSSGTIGDILYSGKVECSSCHEVHNSEGVATPNSPLLRVPQNKRSQGGEKASGLCLTCHDK